MMKSIFRCLAAALACMGCLTAHAAQYHAIYVFKGAPDGSEPAAGLVKDVQGRLYGTTFGGGIYNGGAVFRLTPPTSGTGKWTEEILHSFNGEDGAGPWAPVTLGSDGSIYGTTYTGGIARGKYLGAGEVFRLANAPGWPLTILHTFGKDEGGYTSNGVVFGPDGLLYGTTPYLQITQSHYYDLGTAFSVSPLGDSVEYRIVHDFGKAQDGIGPMGLTQVPPADFNGFAGVTEYGGTVRAGTFYSLKIEPNGLGLEKTRYSFGLTPDLQLPDAPPILGQYALRKRFFGCAIGGGAHGIGGIYRIATDGNRGAAETVLYSFGAQPNDPNPISFPCYVVQGDQSGKLYGTTTNGGAYKGGAFFELDPPTASGGPWTEHVLVSLGAPGMNGGNPQGMPLRNGTSYYGVVNTHSGNGAIYQITP